MIDVGSSVAKLATWFVIGIGFAMIGGTSARAGMIEVFHADLLAGPMAELKKAFEAKNAGVDIKLTSGVSRDLADKILAGETCDVFAPSSPAVADDLMRKKVAGSAQEAASWYVVFSANEMAVITRKGNPLAIRRVVDLAKPGTKFIRVTGEKDLATARTIEFLKRAAKLEGEPDLAQKIVDGAINSAAAAPTSVPEVVRAVREGRADAAVVYYSAAVAARNDLDIVRFPASVNLSEAIRNAATVPATAKNAKEATDFVRFLLGAEGQRILQDTGQPPVSPAIRVGTVPAGVGN